MTVVDRRFRDLTRCRSVSLLVALVLLATLFGSKPASAQYALDTEFTQQDISDRDKLLAAQEHLLSVYRCLFDTDTQLVPGGCANGQPAQPPPGPSVFEGTPTLQEIVERDKLVFTQESLLNVYRCQFDTDTQLVPGGCANGQPAQPPNRFIAVTAGTWHSCGLRVDYTITCWGSNNEKQLETPSGQFTAITAGSFNSCGIRPDNTLSCWGLRQAPTRQYSAVSAGDHTCAIRIRGTLTCWGGRNQDRQLNAPTGNFTAVSAGGNHSCAIRVDGLAFCWGSNFTGQLDAPAGQFTAIAAGSWHSCGLRANRTAVCWGNNSDGQTRAPAGQFTAITAGGVHSCGLRVDFTIVCWGNNDAHNEYGQSDVPHGTYLAVDARSVHTCGLRTDFTIICWGSNRFGPLNPPEGH